MPPPKLYPGLGPLPEALGMSPLVGGVGAGTRERGRELLGRGERGVPTLGEVLFGFEDPRRKLESAYYGVPMPNSAMVDMTPEQMLYEYSRGRPNLGPGASGRVEATPSDATMAEALTGRSIGNFMRGTFNPDVRSKLFQGAMEPLPHMAGQLQGEEFRRDIGKPTLENMIPQINDPSVAYAINQLLPPKNPVYPTPAFDENGQLPFYFR
jgi:hypothetical protein